MYYLYIACKPSLWRHMDVMESALRDDVIKWKHFPLYWPFVGEFPLTKANDAEL